MGYKEYAQEDGKSVDLRKLQARPLTDKEYAAAHASLVIACHDVIIAYQGGLLLVNREKKPVRDTLWVIGGRILRGMSITDSLKKKAKEECGLELEDITYLGTFRTLFNSDPFGHGKGTDTLNLAFFARGKGDLRLDALHSKPRIILPEQYTPEFRKSLHPYIQKLMDEGMKLMGKEKRIPG